MWVLVVIFLAGTEPVAFNGAGQGNTFDALYKCFLARDELLNNSGSVDGYFPPGQQAVCVRTEHGESE